MSLSLLSREEGRSRVAMISSSSSSASLFSSFVSLSVVLQERVFACFPWLGSRTLGPSLTPAARVLSLPHSSADDECTHSLLRKRVSAGLSFASQAAASCTSSSEFESKANSRLCLLCFSAHLSYSYSLTPFISCSITSSSLPPSSFHFSGSRERDCMHACTSTSLE